jgi:hypothetical protein
MLKIMGEPFSLLDTLMSSDGWQDNFCGGCEAWLDEHGGRWCAADVDDPSDSRCVRNAFFLANTRDGVRALERELDEIAELSPSGGRGGW